jgi:hypothetical protein
MGFYYGSGAPPPPKDEGTFKEALLLTLIVFRTLALPLGILFGGIGYLVLVFYLFGLSPFAGLAAILVVVGAIAARGIWEAKHPPKVE